MEIERKFLVKELPEDFSCYPKKEMLQGYISETPVIRLRREDGECKLTVKGPGQMPREEFELDISPEQFSMLWQKLDKGVPVAKTRYYIPIGGALTAELDVYHGGLSGLATVEVEYESEIQASEFMPPDWFGKDVTFDSRYGNSALFLHGLPNG